MAARLALTAAALWLLLAGVAQAQQYQRLHVRSFTLSSDSDNPQLEQPFHVTLTIHVSERVSQVRNVFLPTFSGAEELGDQRETTQGPGGTTYRETLTLVAHTGGTLSVSPAYLDAVDARDDKAKRFISNSLSLPVGGGPVTAVWDALRTAAFVAIDLVLFAAAIFVVVVTFWRRRSRESLRAARDEIETVPDIAQVVLGPPADEVADAFERLREQRDRSRVLQLRAALWTATGAGSGETLGDVLRRPAAGQEHMRRLLITVERAAFIEEARLDGAIEEVLCSPRY